MKQGEFRIWRYMLSLILSVVALAFLIMLTQFQVPQTGGLSGLFALFGGILLSIVRFFFFLGPWVIFYHALTSLPLLVYWHRKGVSRNICGFAVAAISAAPMLASPFAFIAVPVVFFFGWWVGYLNGPEPSKAAMA